MLRFFLHQTKGVPPVRAAVNPEEIAAMEELEDEFEGTIDPRATRIVLKNGRTFVIRKTPEEACYYFDLKFDGGVHESHPPSSESNIRKAAALP